MVDLSMALTSAKALVNAARLAIDARDEAKVKEAVLSLAEKISDLTLNSVALVEKLHSFQSELMLLKAKNAELEKQIADKLSYQLHEFKSGVFVYMSKPSVDGVTVAKHYLCQNCYDKGVKSILRFSQFDPRSGIDGTCAENESHSFYVTLKDARVLEYPILNIS